MSLARFCTLTVLLVILLSTAGLSEDYQPGRLCVVFASGAVDSLWEDSTGFTHCGIAYIDSINLAHGCLDFYFAGHSALPSTKDDYMVIFPDSSNIMALAADYKANPNVFLICRPQLLYRIRLYSN